MPQLRQGLQGQHSSVDSFFLASNIKGPDKFEHDDAGRHLYEAVRQNFPEYLPSAGMDLSLSQHSDD